MKKPKTTKKPTTPDQTRELTARQLTQVVGGQEQKIWFEQT